MPLCFEEKIDLNSPNRVNLVNLFRDRSLCSLVMQIIYGVRTRPLRSERLTG